ncbi:MAG: M1 family aminopeptidase [Bacteroidetes bacterium]|nr:M1 family aminopeptidase [Bacteroidota bacterium]
MKRAILLVCLLVSCLLQAQVTFNAGDLAIIAKGERDAHAGKLKPGNIEATAGYDVKWYRCCWNIDPAVREISGNVTTLFRQAETASDSMVLDLHRDLAVDSVVYHKVSTPWTHVSDLLTIHFPSAIPPNAADSVSVYYHGVPPDNGFGSFGQSIHNGTPVIWTLSEPYGSSDWWPCKNGLTDKADSIDIFIRTPAAYKAASNGLLMSSSAVGSDIIYHWKHRYPVAAYLVCLAVTNYAVYSDLVPYNSDTLEVVNYVYPEDSASAVAQTSAIVPVLQLYDSLFGVYPFQREKYGHTQFGWGGGMEHQTMTFVASFGFELLAHELAHQWFGDDVTCGSWADIWLNEGFATYLSGLCYEHLAPLYWKQFRMARVKSITAYPGGSVYCTDTTRVYRIFDGRLSYAKGAMILHQLRWIMGDSAFFAGVNNYRSDPGLAYGFARTEDLKTHLESACGLDLTWYFDDWFTGEGFPSYQLNWTREQDTVSFTLRQTQSHLSVPFFEMTVPVMFKNASRDTIIRVSNTFSGQSFTVVIPFAVDSVLFDPECQLITGHNTVSAIAGPAPVQGVQIYPNPAASQVTFFVGGNTSNEEVEISVYDLSGRVQDKVSVPRGTTETVLNTSNFAPGIYFYTLNRKNGTLNGKLIILR